MSTMLLGLLLASTGWAGPQRQAVLDLLNAYDEPVRQEDLAALGAGVDAELLEIAQDAAVPLTRRGKAVAALKFYPTTEVRSFLDATLAGQESLLRRKAAYSLAAFGSSAVPALIGALGEPDVQLRVAAANALGTVGDAEGLEALRARLAVETEPAVKKAITAAVGGSR
jgi:HEAT repeat protein